MRFGGAPHVGGGPAIGAIRGGGPHFSGAPRQRTWPEWWFRSGKMPQAEWLFVLPRPGTTSSRA